MKCFQAQCHSITADIQFQTRTVKMWTDVDVRTNCCTKKLDQRFSGWRPPCHSRKRNELYCDNHDPTASKETMGGDRICLYNCRHWCRFDDAGWAVCIHRPWRPSPAVLVGEALNELNDDGGCKIETINGFNLVTKRGPGNDREIRSGSENKCFYGI